MEAGPLPTAMEVHGSTWKQFVASMEAGATCTEAGLPSTSMEVGGSFHGSRYKDRRWNLSWKQMKLLDEASSMKASMEVNGSK